MEENVKLFEKRADAAILADRLRYYQYYKMLEHMAEDRGLIATGSIGTRILVPPDEYVLRELFIYEFFGDFYDAKMIADAFAKIDNDLGYHIVVKGAFKKHSIWVNQRVIAVIHEIPRTRGQSVLKIIMPNEGKGLFGTTLLCSGAEIQLIRVCTQLTNPAFFEDWISLLAEYQVLIKVLFNELHDKLKNVTKIGGGLQEDVLKLKPDVLKYATSTKCIVLQSAGTRVQLVSATALEDVAADISEIMERRGIKTGFTIDNINVPGDPQLKRLTMHAEQETKHKNIRVPLLDVFNIAKYELAPYINNYEATAFLKMRCRLVDLWVILSLTRIGAIPVNRSMNLLFETEGKLKCIAKCVETTPPHELLPLKTYIGQNCAEVFCGKMCTFPYHPRAEKKDKKDKPDKPNKPNKHANLGKFVVKKKKSS